MSELKALFMGSLLALALAGCSQGEQAKEEQQEPPGTVTEAEQPATTKQSRPTNEPTAAQGRQTIQEATGGSGREGGARARAEDNAVARANGGEEAVGTNTERAQEITLKVGGDDGTRFSGVCSVGNQEKTIGGRVPARYAYHLGGDKLECEIRKEGRGALEVVVAAGSNVRFVQRTSARNSTIYFAYSGGGGISSSIHGSPGRRGRLGMPWAW